MFDAADTPFVYCMGDFNADISRNQLFGTKLKHFCTAEGLYITDEVLLPADRTHISEHQSEFHLLA